MGITWVIRFANHSAIRPNIFVIGVGFIADLEGAGVQYTQLEQLRRLDKKTGGGGGQDAQT